MPLVAGVLVIAGFAPAFGSTVTVTASGVETPKPSFTTSEKVSAACCVTSGAVNVGLGAAASESVTASPAVWVHA